MFCVPTERQQRLRQRRCEGGGGHDLGGGKESTIPSPQRTCSVPLSEDVSQEFPAPRGGLNTYNTGRFNIIDMKDYFSSHRCNRILEIGEISDSIIPCNTSLRKVSYNIQV